MIWAHPLPRESLATLRGIGDRRAIRGGRQHVCSYFRLRLLKRSGAGRGGRDPGGQVLDLYALLHRLPGSRFLQVQFPTEIPQVQVRGGVPHKKPTDKTALSGISRHEC